MQPQIAQIQEEHPFEDEILPIVVPNSVNPLPGLKDPAALCASIAEPPKTTELPEFDFFKPLKTPAKPLPPLNWKRIQYTDDMETLHLYNIYEETPRHEYEYNDFEKHYKDNMRYCPEYANKIFFNLRERELEFLDVTPDYPALHPRMRSYPREEIVNYLFFESKDRLKLSNETFLVAVHLMDRFLSIRVMEKGHHELDLVAATCLWISDKYHDNKRDLWEYGNIADRRSGYIRKREVRQLERYILRNVEHRLGYPDAMTFFDHIFLVENDPMTLIIGHFLCYLSGMDDRFTGIMGSLCFAAAM